MNILLSAQRGGTTSSVVRCLVLDLSCSNTLPDEPRKCMISRFLQLGGPETYKILSSGDCVRLDGVDDAAKFKDVKNALETIGMTDATQMEVSPPPIASELSWEAKVTSFMSTGCTTRVFSLHVLTSALLCRYLSSPCPAAFDVAEP